MVKRFCKYFELLNASHLLDVILWYNPLNIGDYFCSKGLLVPEYRLFKNKRSVCSLVVRDRENSRNRSGVPVVIFGTA